MKKFGTNLSYSEFQINSGYKVRLCHKQINIALEFITTSAVSRVVNAATAATRRLSRDHKFKARFGSIRSPVSS